MPTDEEKAALLSLLQQIETEDQFVLVNQQREFKRNNLFWHGFQYLFWSGVDQDWRVPTHEQLEELSGREDTKYIFDYVINIFKAHGESIIAALSSDIPETQFGPRNAQDIEDLRAVEAANNAVELIERQNRAKMLIIQALFYLCNEGFVASYTYNKKSEEYGTVEIPEYGVNKVQTTSFVCNSCGYESPEPEQQCPQCGAGMEPETKEEEVPFQTGTKLIPKGQEIIEIYGPLNVRVPASVGKLGDAGYLLQYVDADPAQFKAAFPNCAEEIGSDPGQDYGRIMRQSSLTMDGMLLNSKLVTQKRVWLRTWFLERLEDGEVKDSLKKKYPNGLYFSFINETQVEECRPEPMEKHWSITKAGPSKGVHADPLLKSLVSIQQQRNNLNNLFTMQVEYGVPATYADTEVFDFEGQSRQEVSPGYIYPVTPRPGQSIAEAFYSEKTSNLSKESTELLVRLDADGQFVVGDYPSIYGGPSVSGSKTLGEYEKSRTFALQRLALVWYFLNVWWAETTHKAVVSFIAHQIEDESFTVKNNGAWLTKWVKKADFKGSFDRLEPEASSDFPVSFSQKRALLMTLFQLNNPDINSVLFHPENARIVQSYVGLTELNIPGDVQKQKQVREIMTLIGLEPGIGEAGQMISPVPVESEIDDHEIHILVLKDFLASNTGQDLKLENPAGYAACMAHLQQHQMALQPPPGVMNQVGGPNVGPPQPQKGLQTNVPVG